jgi:cytochrome oxidase Cu insertion factor (SCO1/SenC/PrrC family)
MTDPTSPHASARLRLTLLLSLFAAPVLGAYALYFWAPQGWRPAGRTHQGHLLNPARPVESLSLHDVAGQRVDTTVLRDKWTLLLVGSARCGENCRTRLYDTRQVRTALGRNMPRVQRIYVATDRDDIETLGALLAREHPDLRLLVTEGSEIDRLDRQFNVDGRSPLTHPGDLYLLDPHGNWLMVYTPADPPQGLLKDLKKLLRLSNIG